MPSNYGSGQGNFPKSQKRAVWFLAFLAVLIALGGVWQIGAAIKRPFAYKETKVASSRAGIESDYVNLLKSRDTDGDGLSDYDEIFVYKTSPYLEDTDGDGISDYDEVMIHGTDPNCPQGQNCLVSLEVAVSPRAVAGDEINWLGLESAAGLEFYPDLSLDSAGASEDLLRGALSGQISPANLRELLRQSGLDQEILNQISDEDLMRGYQETLNSQDAY